MLRLKMGSVRMPSSPTGNDPYIGVCISFFVCVFFVAAVEVVELLLRTPGMDGTIVNAIDKNGDTAALLAARSGHDRLA